MNMIVLISKESPSLTIKTMKFISVVYYTVELSLHVTYSRSWVNNINIRLYLNIT